MSRKTFTRLVQVSQSPETKIDVNLVLSEKPRRQEQKLATLKKYVEQYPSGWKKRLQLADLLYEMGDWIEAIEAYRQVVERKPELLPVQLKLAKLLQLILHG